MLGKPKYTYGDKVKFDINYEGKTYLLEGAVNIIDAYGTFEQNEEVSYDIIVENGDFPSDYPCLFKHIRESDLYEEEK